MANADFRSGDEALVKFNRYWFKILDKQRTRRTHETALALRPEQYFNTFKY